jgi:predicted nucleotidyltransferase
MPIQEQHRIQSALITMLEQALPLIRERYGVARIGIFGSVARGQERNDSDVDVLVEFMPDKATFRNFMELALYLESLFARRVDLVTDQALNPYLRTDIEKEVVWC